MDKRYLVVDLEEYREGEGIDLVLEGWRASLKPGPVEVRVLADGEPVPFSEVRRPREDVIENVPELSGISPQVGFTLTIPSVDGLWGRYGTILVQAVQGDEEMPLWERPAAQIKERDRKSVV